MNNLQVTGYHEQNMEFTNLIHSYETPEWLWAKHGNKIYFTEPVFRVKSKPIPWMRFKTPIKLKQSYRVIPNFPKYAVSISGIVIVAESGKKITINRNGPYPTVEAYDPISRDYRTVMLHKLIALAWVPNKNPVNRPFVNHKNGNKQDFRPINLEWCSALENIEHAFKNNLRSDNFECTVFDAVTEATSNFESVRSAAKHMGLHPDTSFKRMKNKMRREGSIAGRFLIELKDPTRRGLNSGNITVTAISDCDVLEFTSLRKAATFFKVDRKTILLRTRKGKFIDGYKLSISPTPQ